MHDFIQFKTIQPLGCWWQESKASMSWRLPLFSLRSLFVSWKSLSINDSLVFSCKETEQKVKCSWNVSLFFSPQDSLTLEWFSLAGSDPASPLGLWILLAWAGCSDGGAAGSRPHFMPLQVSQWNSVGTSATGTSHKTNWWWRGKEKIRSFFLLCRQLGPWDQGGLSVLLGPKKEKKSAQTQSVFVTRVTDGCTELLSGKAMGRGGYLQANTSRNSWRARRARVTLGEKNQIRTEKGQQEPANTQPGTSPLNSPWAPSPPPKFLLRICSML